jgi:hypothetical protein
LQGRPSALQQQWRRVVPRATASGGVWIHAPPPLKVAEPVDRGRLPLLCLPTPTVKITDTCNKGNNAQQQLILVLFFSFVLQICISLRSSVSFRFPFVLYFKRPAV